MFRKLKRFTKPFVLTVNRFGYMELMTAHADGTITGTTVWCKKPMVTTHRFWMKWRLHAFVAKDDIKNLQKDTEKAYSGTWYMQ